MNSSIKKTIREKLLFIYGNNSNFDIDDTMNKIEAIIHKYRDINVPSGFVDEKDAILITYSDNLIRENEYPLATLKKFMKNYVGDRITSIHLLAMFPYSSDDGFSVIDYRSIDPKLGNWEDIRKLSRDYKLMYDAVINHVSKESQWFQEYLKGNRKYEGYFLDCDPGKDYSEVVRPRTTPLLTRFSTINGEKHIWTTFSDDQIDLNFGEPEVLLEIIDLLLFYAQNGAKYIRLDAVGFLWKELGTSCIHHPKTHEIVKLIRLVLNSVAGDVIIITETNVPHEENISYFGNNDEAHMVYQFPLAPLVLYSFITESAVKLSDWASTIDASCGETTYLNFLASHDGIGLRPVEGILTEEERKMMIDTVLARGGRISYKLNPDNSRTPYEMNINYQDALSPLSDSETNRLMRFMGAETILMSLVGVPGIYIHSLLGSRNYYKGVEESGINRRINREQLNYETLINELDSNTHRARVLNEHLRRLEIRRNCTAFSPKARQKILRFDDRVFAVLRNNETTGERVLALINVSSDTVRINTNYSGIDLLTGIEVSGNVEIKPFDCMWIKC